MALYFQEDTICIIHTCHQHMENNNTNSVKETQRHREQKKIRSDLIRMQRACSLCERLIFPAIYFNLLLSNFLLPVSFCIWNNNKRVTETPNENETKRNEFVVT